MLTKSLCVKSIFPFALSLVFIAATALPAFPDSAPSENAPHDNRSAINPSRTPWTVEIGAFFPSNMGANNRKIHPYAVIILERQRVDIFRTCGEHEG
jgi:hypothetical protein